MEHHQLAGFEMGSTKLAALAMKAQIIRNGSASTPALRTAACTAGVSTTAVASFDSSTGTPMPTTYTMLNRRTDEPAAARTARRASQSNTPV